ncbi:MAG: hypothetical protein LBD74_08610 [Spirochaetaceae bacterium]|jgi:hypothetical protein|nr:hypothetical protein [Spirochaetaceae bacterium]
MERTGRFSLPMTFCSLCLFLGACETELFAPEYVVEVPALPAAWQAALGKAHWRLMWIGPDGRWDTAETGLRIRVLAPWTTPVLAYPYWPEHGIGPDMVRPCGGLFPWDVEGTRIRLSWTGGVQAVVYRELAAQAGESSSRLPHYFNWPRFRELLAGESLSEAVRQDLWSVDWGQVCQKTVQSGFDRRRIVARPQTTLRLTVDRPGPWIGSSPFAEPVDLPPGKEIELLFFGKEERYFSPKGMLLCTEAAWMWIPFPLRE